MRLSAPNRNLAHPAGLEPAPYGLEDRCPIHWTTDAKIIFKRCTYLITYNTALTLKMANTSIKSLSSVAKEEAAAMGLVSIAADK